MNIQQLCQHFNLHYPYPSCMELQSQQQKTVWRRVEALGYAKIVNGVRCGYERLAGEYVHLTEQGYQLLTSSQHIEITI